MPLVQRAYYANENTRDKKFEKEVAQKKLESHPEQVTEESSVRAFYEGPETKATDPTTTAGVKKDLKTLKDTLSLGEVPPVSLQLGLAGTLPYLGTSLATTYLSWDLNTEWPSQSQFVNHFLMSHESASHYLHLLEPIQVGYGAVIISFLGAIHWGLEYAEKHPDKARTTFRYGLGVLAPVLAWPTMIMPVQYALTAQFGAFVFMYFADARATTRGWAPTWYGTYRFVLTAIVGLSLFISLVGREKVGADKPRLTGLREKFHKEQPNALDMKKYEEMEAVELEKNRKKKAAEDRRKAAEEEIQKLEEEKNNAETDKKKVDEEKPKKGKTEGKKSESKESKGKDESKGNEKPQEDGKDEGKKDGSGDDSKGGGKAEKGDEKKDDKSE
ncbi:putative mitochondrial inner membrane protein 1 [Diaporthe ampelina]|uniref:Putative mitochondrial inner membrane protein 1 n=1 Tax=Diaporthe ampelina TaxID=1214573 RepID=A0A0G2HDD2_9PEZI|nr:putative mitochondrial inner membrane protein 1 [Diaporthe ampelina]